jgi:hypothetical protein
VEREIESLRRSWLGNIRKVVDAPHGHKVMLLPPEVVESDGALATPIRLVDDPSAPAYRKIDPNKTHPYRQKEVVEEINKALAGAHNVSPYDIHVCAKCIRYCSLIRGGSRGLHTLGVCSEKRCLFMSSDDHNGQEISTSDKARTKTRVTTTRTSTRKNQGDARVGQDRAKTSSAFTSLSFASRARSAAKY